MQLNANMLFVYLTILFTCYGQLILKWRLIDLGRTNPSFNGNFSSILSLLFDPFVLSGLGAAFFAALSWMYALTKFPLSKIYPLVSFSFLIVLVFSALFFNESVSKTNLIGCLVIVLGTYLAVR